MNKIPIIICDVSCSMFSLARHSGGAIFNGRTYYYKPERDILVRDDWDKVYSKVDWNTFYEAVKSGVKPKIPKKVNQRKTIDNNIKSLFD